MARPTARVLGLLAVLQAGGTHTVGSLAATLGVDERTVRRYAAHLLDLDVPVESVRGRYGGYRLGAGHRLPPLMLTEEETLAVLLGLRSTRSPAAGTAAAKLRRVLPPHLADRLDALTEAADLDATTTAPAAGVLLLLAEAARDRRPVAFAYDSRGGRRSARTLHPYGILARAGRWYVTGLDSDSGEQRTFRLDRIALPRLLPGTFEVPDDVEPAATALARTPWRHDVALRVSATRDEVRRWFPDHLATLEELADGWLRLRLRVEHLDWLPGRLASLDRPFVVESPDELRVELRAAGERLAAQAFL